MREQEHHGAGIPKKPPERCAEEVRLMHRHGYRGFALADDIFTSDNPWAKRVAEAITRTGVRGGRDLTSGGGRASSGLPAPCRPPAGPSYVRRRELAMRSARSPMAKNTPLNKMNKTPGSQSSRRLPEASEATTSPAPTRNAAPESRTKSLIGL